VRFGDSADFLQRSATDVKIRTPYNKETAWKKETCKLLITVCLLKLLATRISKEN